jgi:hypothetical protein
MSYDVIDKNTKDYAHKLREDYDKLTRVDFTQTLSFVSAQVMRVSKDAISNNAIYSFLHSFDLNDQVSQF